jgi:hypothetical protein
MANPLVESWFRQYLHREPDPSGLEFWERSLSSGASETQVLSQFLASNEYIGKAGNDHAGFIRTLFRDFMGRHPSPPEMADWVPRLQTKSYQQVAYEYLLAIGR